MTEPDRAPGGGRAPAGPPGRLTEPGRSSPGGPGPRPTDGQANGRLRLVTVVAAAVARSDPNPDHGKWSESRWPPAGAAALRAGAISKSVPSLRLRVVAAPWQQLSPVYVTRTVARRPRDTKACSLFKIESSRQRLSCRHGPDKRSGYLLAPRQGFITVRSSCSRACGLELVPPTQRRVAFKLAASRRGMSR